MTFVRIEPPHQDEEEHHILLPAMIDKAQRCVCAQHFVSVLIR
jgi:hypothetical protein